MSPEKDRTIRKNEYSEKYCLAKEMKANKMGGYTYGIAHHGDVEWSAEIWAMYPSGIFCYESCGGQHRWNSVDKQGVGKIE